MSQPSASGSKQTTLGKRPRAESPVEHPTDNAPKMPRKGSNYGTDIATEQTGTASLASNVTQSNADSSWKHLWQASIWVVQAMQVRELNTSMTYVQIADG